MQYGPRNNIHTKATSITKGNIMSLIKFKVTVPAQMASVLTTESVDRQT